MKLVWHGAVMPESKHVEAEFLNLTAKRAVNISILTGISYYEIVDKSEWIDPTDKKEIEY